MRRPGRILAAVAALLLLAAAGAVLLLNSGWFREQARARIVAEIERTTGGRAALDSFDFDWRTLTATVRGFVLRGREPAAAEPLFKARLIELKLSVLSWLSRDIRLRSLTLQQPRVQIFVYPDGTTNLPQPKMPRKEGNPLEDLMRLRIGRIDLRGGWFRLDHQTIPLDVSASGLDLRLAFDAANRRYRTESSMTELRLPGGYKPSLQLAGWLEPRRFQFDQASARSGESRAVMSGFVTFSPFEVQAGYDARLKLADIPQLGIPLGGATVSGKFHLAAGQLDSAGTVAASGVSFTAAGVRIEQASLNGAFDLRRNDLQLRALSFSTPFGSGQGEARIRHWRTLEVSANLANIDVERVQRVLFEKPYAWSGTAKGPVTLTASLAENSLTVERMNAAMEIEPAAGAAPVGGSITLAWNRQDGLLTLDGTSLFTPASRLNVRGALGQALEVSLTTTSIRDLEPAVAVFSREERFSLPLAIDNGEARVDATIRGPLDRPRIAGAIHLRNARVDEAPFDRFDARFDLAPDRLVVSDLVLKQHGATMSGRISAQLDNWTVAWASSVDLALRVENAEAQRILGLLRVKSPLTGEFDGTIEAHGPAGAPALKVRISGAGLQLGGETVRKASLALAAGRDGAFQGKLVLDAMSADLAGYLRHADGDFTNGSARISVKTSSLRMAELESLQRSGFSLDGVLSVDAAAELSFSPAGLQWSGVDGLAAAPEIRFGGRRLEKVELRSTTLPGALELSLKCALRGESGQFLTSTARLNLDGAPLLEGQAAFPRLSFAFLRALFTPPSPPGAAAPEELPVRGFVEGTARYSVNLAQPAAARASITINRLQLRPRGSQVLDTQIDPGELVLSNSSPLLVDIEAQRATIRPASFTARETRLTLSGAAGLTPGAPLNLRLTGDVNLALLSTFRPGVEVNGRAAVDATVRGTPADPSLSGRMTVSGASFFLQDLPNGIENANGTIFFEKNRANIEKLSGQTGGGEFLITGFLGINAGELNYRLNAKGKSIRLRYPEGVSTTADASLDLIGTPSRTLLSGVVTVLKSSIVGGGDFGEVVGGAASPIPPPATRNEFLRNLQFDVRIRTAPDATLVSSYTEGLETEANLQLRGSPSKPVLLGTVEVNQGTIRFFGNRYAISRGEILFYNTAVIQPAIDLDLETRIRGVTVYINVSGPLARLNVNYRSEPPLQSNEILALLTVGRAPAATASNLQASSSIRNQNVLENTSSNSLLGGALSAGISNRVERFFGASRIKIDPQATGVDNVAQARLSIEQSLSRDVTVTFVTNLSRTQEQIVRVEWDVSRRWQVIAVRDENGVFAVDFMYRTRFK